MSDTTTTLNPGSGGTVMDESLVTQSDGSTQAHRTRVVIGADDDGEALVNPLAEDPGASPVSLPALAVGLVNDAISSYVAGELRALSMTPEGRLRVSSVPASNNPDYFGDSRVSFAGEMPYENTLGGNPWRNS